MKLITITDSENNSLSYEVSDENLNTFIENIPSLGFIGERKEFNALGEEIIIPKKYSYEITDITNDDFLKRKEIFAMQLDKECNLAIRNRLAEVIGQDADETTHLALYIQCMDKIKFPEEYTSQEVLEAQSLRLSYKAAWADVQALRNNRDISIKNFT